ncbi:hypothetical protein Ae201684_004418 [Aphanomyces euteiches]|uniref:Uncharacterized protein n=1 Tax=Aphanomyces euteiches TaxID=100861 RepID=A0A6G0XIR6_9STRA|nr:hypothetical protein Ae201684_004418 [Aphanomyces euteiches]
METLSTAWTAFVQVDAIVFRCVRVHSSSSKQLEGKQEKVLHGELIAASLSEVVLITVNGASAPNASKADLSYRYVGMARRIVRVGKDADNTINADHVGVGLSGRYSDYPWKGLLSFSDLVLGVLFPFQSSNFIIDFVDDFRVQGGDFVDRRVLRGAGLFQQRDEFLQFFNAFNGILDFSAQTVVGRLQVGFQAAAFRVAVARLNVREFEVVVVVFQRINQILVLNQLSVVGKVDRFRFTLVQKTFSQNVVMGLLQAVQRLTSASIAELGTQRFPVRAQRNRGGRAELAARVLDNHTQGVHSLDKSSRKRRNDYSGIYSHPQTNRTFLNLSRQTVYNHSIIIKV